MGVDLTPDTLVKIFADNFSVIRSEPKIPPVTHSLQLRSKIDVIKMLPKISKYFK